MNFLIVFIWVFLVGIPGIFILMWFAGGIMFAIDKVKAIRYLAKKYDDGD